MVCGAIFFQELILSRVLVWAAVLRVDCSGKSRTRREARDCCNNAGRRWQDQHGGHGGGVNGRILAVPASAANGIDSAWTLGKDKKSRATAKGLPEQRLRLP